MKNDGFLTENNESVLDANSTSDTNNKFFRKKTDQEQSKLSKFEIKKKIKNTFKKIVSIFLWFVGFVLLFLCLSNLYQQLVNKDEYTGFFGIGEAVVISESMEPEISVNDLIFYKDVPLDKIEVGDVVVYKRVNDSGETILIVHEVQQLSDGYLVAKGIANAEPDEAVSVDAIVGKYLFKVSNLGIFLSLFSTIWAPIMVAVLFTLFFVVRITLYVIHRKRVIRSISTNEHTRKAVDYFFEI